MKCSNALPFYRSQAFYRLFLRLVTASVGHHQPSYDLSNGVNNE